MHQDVSLYAGTLDRGETVTQSLARGRSAWVHIAQGSARVNDQLLQAGDGAAVSEEAELTLTAEEPADILVFDLA